MFCLENRGEVTKIGDFREAGGVCELSFLSGKKLELFREPTRESALVRFAGTIVDKQSWTLSKPKSRGIKEVHV